MLMRALYSILWYAALPWLPLRLWWRGRREPGYREKIGERFGRYPSSSAPPNVVWIHAVSLGETRAAAPLVARVLREMPEATVLLSHMTATGRAAGAELAKDRVVQAWLPYDVPFAVHAFLAHWKPRAGLLMETEVWPNLVEACSKGGIPLFLVNARLSARSLRGYQRFAGVTRPMFAALAGIAAQTEEDARRLRDAGARDVAVTGNLKFDVQVDDSVRTRADALRDVFGVDRPRWIAASTRDGEEALILDALAQHPLPGSTLTVIVPRHPQRFDEVAALFESRGLRCVRRSANVPVPPDARFVLGDSLGELLAYYAAADVAFVGGSLLPLGGQNLIESIAVGTPTLIGPHTFNFAEAAAQAVTARAALRVADARALATEVDALLRDPARRARMHDAALAFHAAHRGATDRLWSWLASRIVKKGQAL
jgi:3-deoxy-D-manno-octulosonic-acid transferase